MLLPCQDCSAGAATLIAPVEHALAEAPTAIIPFDAPTEVPSATVPVEHDEVKHLWRNQAYFDRVFPRRATAIGELGLLSHSASSR